LSKNTKDRWLTWDKLYNSGNYAEVVRQFDSRVENNITVTVGDVVRRNHALEALGVKVTDKDYGTIIKTKHARYLEGLQE